MFSNLILETSFDSENVFLDLFPGTVLSLIFKGKFSAGVKKLVRFSYEKHFFNFINQSLFLEFFTQ